MFYKERKMRSVSYFNDGWKFYRGSLAQFPVISKLQTYNGVKTGNDLRVLTDERLTQIFNDVRLPHDYVILDTPDERKNASEGYLEGDEGWYLKRFDFPEKYIGKQVYLHFEGIAIESEIYLNGTLLRRNFSAYNPITVNISDFVRSDIKNILAVHVKQSKRPEGWWYQGGGIYRDVKLIVTENVAVDTFGTYVKPVKRPESDIWDTRIEVTIRNDELENKTVTVKNSITDRNGSYICSVEGSVDITFKDKAIFVKTCTVENPLLWDIDSPNLYTLTTELYDGEAKVDEYKTVFGFRTVRFDGEKGFFLNGRNVKLKGFCAHQDYGITGIYLPRSVARYRLELMQKMGCNSYRSAHNLSDENTMNFCDEMGILVYDETRYFSTSPETLSYVEDMLKRDRNHPCVIVWSIGNEEKIQHLEYSKRIAETMTAFVKKFDDRPVTIACHADGGVENNVISAPIDVLSMNYSIEKHDIFHDMYPGRSMIMSESCALQSSRGIYFGDDKARELYDARDHVQSPLAFNGSTRTETWRHVMSRDYIAGMYIWAGIEHRGETQWPRLCSQSGLVDLFLQKKEAYYQTMSQYSTEKMVHICPETWNFKGLEGTVIPVEVYTNCDSVELLLNGKSLGKKYYRDYEPCRWDVEYIPGELCAVAYDEKGSELCRHTIETTEAAHSLKIICDTPNVQNDGHDCIVYTVVCLDKDGREVPNASPRLNFSVSGGVLLGTGSAVTDHIRPMESTRDMYFGKASACVYIPKDCDKVTVVVTADGLAASSHIMQFVK